MYPQRFLLISAAVFDFDDEKGEGLSQASVKIPETCDEVKGGRVGPGRTQSQERLFLMGRAAAGRGGAAWGRGK